MYRLFTEFKKVFHTLKYICKLYFASIHVPPLPPPPRLTLSVCVTMHSCITVLTQPTTAWLRLYLAMAYKSLPR